MKRRAFLASPMLLVASAARAVDYPRVMPGAGFAFPRDHGSHPAFRTEWWYVTGWVKDGSGNEFGIQVTFFRHRPGIAEDNPSAFAPRQLLFAHAALADSRHGRLRHDQRAARAGFGLAEAREDATDVRIGDWSLTQADGAFVARIAAREFAFDLRFALTQAPLPEGDAGYSRKGPDPRQASYYYSCPQLAVSGDDHHRGAHGGDHRDGVARSRMVERIHGGRRGGLGLDRHQSRRRRRADGVPDARPRRQGAVGGRHAPRRERADAHVRARRDPLRRAAAVAVAADGGRFSGRDGGQRRAAPTTRSRRCSTIRSSIRAAAPGRSIGKARSARSRAGARSARATSN